MNEIVAHRLAATPDICKTLYFWWIAFLRCSPDYWWICKENGQCEDERLHQVWKHFGNIYEYTTVFHYWQEHAHRLFDSPQQQLNWTPSITEALALSLVSPSKIAGAEDDKFYFSAAKHVSFEEAIAAFQKIWELATASGQRNTTDAPFQLGHIDPKSRRTIVHAYCAHVLEDTCKKSPSSNFFSQWRSYEMARFLNIFGRSKKTTDDTLVTARRSQGCIRTLFGQKKRVAQQLIANVEVGLFPCRKKVLRMRRWTACQEKRLRNTISSHAWRPKDWILGEHGFLLPHLDLSSNTVNDSENPAVLTAVKNFSVLDSSQLGKP